MDRAMLERDATFDGLFFVAVKTTGIFCRPTCPARKPKVENVEYFASSRDALHAGYRPCKRCRPMDANGARPRWIEQVMEAVDRSPSDRFTDADLRAMGVDPARARRYFKSHYGMTFHAYHRARRLGLALQEVRQGEDLTGVGYGHGYESASGFRDAFARVFGAPPGKGPQVKLLYARWLDTPLGAMLAVANDEALGLLEFVDRRAIERQIETLRRRMGGAVIVPGHNAVLDQTAGEVASYFAGDLRDFTVPIALPGSPFQTDVWNELRTIPYGETRSYSDLAKALGRPGAQRAVGRANGDNRLAIIVPCHRVVRSDGSLCGYGGGLWRKKRLLELERRHA
jgi:AraC family transcriptional regulator of adaptative response/methylated-DNA-[protein]-cysteine methyltransferase